MDTYDINTHPKQKVITVFKEECKKDFLQLPNCDWQAACNTLTYMAFKMYLYMASNRNGYSFALSYVAVNNLIPMNRNTYDNCIKELINNGYLVHIRGNNWSFHANL